MYAYVMWDAIDRQCHNASETEKSLKRSRADDARQVSQQESPRLSLLPCRSHCLVAIRCSQVQCSRRG